MAKLLSHPTEPVDVRERRISELLEAMARTGFQGRRLGEAFLAWREMLRDESCVVFFGMSGAMIPAGMRRVVAHLIEHRFVDVVVTTGANVFHDIHEALGGKHYQGMANADDARLLKHGIDRIYDIFAREDEFRNMDRLISQLSRELSAGKEYSSREIVAFLGEKLAERGSASDSFVVTAYRRRVPVFVPALGDSSVGIGLTLARREGHSVVVSQLKDVDEITQIVEKAAKTGVVYVGGGVPKNFIQQTEVIASILGVDKGGHDYAVQFTTDAPHWGGLSGCTLEEAVSWGKVSSQARRVQCFVDATIALPIVAHALNEVREEFKARPAFEWEG
ncbi:deoxyhypusine synthase [Candidatus Pyrohabitans sp.]